MGPISWSTEEKEVEVVLEDQPGAAPEDRIVFLYAGYTSRTYALLSESELDELIVILKKAKAAAWPKPLKPLCPSSNELLTYLKKYGSVTPLKAREELGIEHLPRRIKDLKEHGHSIVTEYKAGHYGRRYAHYVLKESVS